MKIIRWKWKIIHDARGFSLIEAMIAMGITLVVMGAAVGAFKSMSDSSLAVNQAAEVRDVLRAATKLMRRDIQQTGGRNFPQNGIQLPVSARGKVLSPNSSVQMAHPVVPYTIGGMDAVKILQFRGTDFDFPNGLEDMAGGAGTFGLVPADKYPTNLNPGDYLYIGDSFLQQVTTIIIHQGHDTRIEFGVGDPAGVNPASLGGAASGVLTARLMRLVTYSRELDPATGIMWLMRRTNNAAPARLVPGITTMDITYNVSPADGSLVTFNPNSQPVTDETLQNIRGVNITFTCDSEDTTVVNGIGRPVVSNDLRTSIAVRRYRDRFR